MHSFFVWLHGCASVTLQLRHAVRWQARGVLILMALAAQLWLLTYYGQTLAQRPA